LVPSGRLIPFDAVPELVQKIDRLLGNKVFFSEGTVIVPKDIPENHNGDGTFMLSVEESQDLIFLLEEYGFSAATEKRYDPLGYWDYIVFIVPAVPEIELVKRQDRRPSLV
jgi:hypothetical protein